MMWPLLRGKVRVRSARPEDVEVVRALLTQTWHDTYDHLYGAERVRQITAEWHSAHRLGGQIGQPDSAFLLAESRGRIVGTGFAHMTGADEAEIGRIYVLPGWQGRGIGTRLVAALVGRLPNARALRLEVEPRNERAIRFYERHGFVRAGMAEHCNGDGSTWSALIMERNGGRG